MESVSPHKIPFPFPYILSLSNLYLLSFLTLGCVSDCDYLRLSHFRWPPPLFLFLSPVIISTACYCASRFYLLRFPESVSYLDVSRRRFHLCFLTDKSTNKRARAHTHHLAHLLAWIYSTVHPVQNLWMISKIPRWSYIDYTYIPLFVRCCYNHVIRSFLGCILQEEIVARTMVFYL